MESAKNFVGSDLTKYIFFTGKGGVGKTSTACSLAVALADRGKRVMLVSTDPASNLQDVFGVALDNKGTAIDGVKNLVVANFEPEAAARDYRESVVGPYRGLLPESAIANMEEQLSGSCTVEIAAFNEFTHFITDQATAQDYDHVIFDTAPTGHTLRMLELPAAWTTFIDSNKSGASCLGQLSGLGEKKEYYANAVRTLCDGELTTLVLVSRPDEAPLKEAARASKELKGIGIHNQVLIINGVLECDEADLEDEVAHAYRLRQTESLKAMGADLAVLPKYSISLRPFSVLGIENLRSFFDLELREVVIEKQQLSAKQQGLDVLIDDLHASKKRVVFTMGKGGVGKSTLAAAIARGLWQKGESVHLTTTDPAAHIMAYQTPQPGLKVSFLDEEKALVDYKADVLSTALKTMTKEELDYLEEDLSSPCTQEIAVFRAFAQLVEGSKEDIVVIDTAPTGHTLLLLDATLSYHREIERSKGYVPDAVKDLLPKLRNPEHTTVVIVTLAEPTPVHEALRLSQDLDRAGIHAKWWAINGSLATAKTKNAVLAAKSNEELQWIDAVREHSEGHFVVTPWR